MRTGEPENGLCSRWIGAAAIEGPHIHYYAERVRQLVGQQVIRLGGERSEAVKGVRGRTLRDAFAVGKLLFLAFGNDGELSGDGPDEGVLLRLHCLMFGDVRVNRTRPGKRLTLRLTFRGGDSTTRLYLYLGAARIASSGEIESSHRDRDISAAGQPSLETMRLMQKDKSTEAICDVLLDQEFFPGLGNKIKNEALFEAGIHPLTRCRKLSTQSLERLRDAIAAFTDHFKRRVAEQGDRVQLDYQVFRRQRCPTCGAKLEHAKLGQLDRKCHFCPVCQRADPPAGNAASITKI